MLAQADRSNIQAGTSSQRSASEPLKYSEKQYRPTCRSPREHRPEDQTTDAMDIGLPETRFRGRSETLLYNRQRIHSAIGYIIPEQAEAKSA